MAIAVQLRHRSAIGWLVATTILLNGWLPILFQAAFVAAPTEAVAEGHAHHAGASAQPEPNPVPPSKGPECPVLHSAICLCAVLVKALPVPTATPALATTRRVRVRLPARRLRRQVRVASFEARAPPFSDRAQNST